MKSTLLRAAVLPLALFILSACAPISPDLAEVAIAPAEGAPTAEKSMLNGDQFVTLDNGVNGTMHVPEGEGPFPTVLMLHGFGSRKDEAGNLYLRLATKLGEVGIGSLRIDFGGLGQYATETQTGTIDSQVNDALVATQWLEEQVWVDSEQIGLLGFSLGSGVAIVVAAQRPELIKSLVTWSPMGGFEWEFSGPEFDAVRATAAAEGKANTSTLWGPIVLSNEFFESLTHYDIADLITSYSGAYYAIAGDLDYTAEFAQAYAESSAANPSRVWLVPGTDHIFDSFQDSVLDATVEWFQETLQ